MDDREKKGYQLILSSPESLQGIFGSDLKPGSWPAIATGRHVARSHKFPSVRAEIPMPMELELGG